MTSFIPFIAVVAFVVLISMLGLGLGVLLKKKTPLKGSCRGAACEAQGHEGRRHEGCACHPR